MGKAVGRQTWSWKPQYCDGLDVTGREACSHWGRILVSLSRDAMGCTCGSSDPHHQIPITLLWTFLQGIKLWVGSRKREKPCIVCTHAHVEIREHCRASALSTMWILESQHGPSYLLITHPTGPRSWYSSFQAVGDLQKRKHALLGTAGSAPFSPLY